MPKRHKHPSAYRRRLARNLAKGYSRSQARGHPRVGEQHVSPKAAERKPDRRLLEGLGALRKTGSLTEASRQSKVSPERLRRFTRSLDFVEKQGGRYVVGPDLWERRVLLYSNRRRVTTAVQGYEEARRVGLYWEAVGEFLRSNDPAYLAPFKGAQITDAAGKKYTLETRPNVLYRLNAEGGDPFEQVYQIVV
jgi:hypothetical protein